MNRALHGTAKGRGSKVFDWLARHENHLAESSGDAVEPVNANDLGQLARLKLVECGSQDSAFDIENQSQQAKSVSARVESQ
jgi:hypothetical protein